MREVVLYQLLSLDGVAEAPGDWLFDTDSAIFENLGQVIDGQDAVLLGRKTYDYWVGYFDGKDALQKLDLIDVGRAPSGALLLHYRVDDRRDAPE